jgi:hypothetical protein
MPASATFSVMSPVWPGCSHLLANESIILYIAFSALHDRGVRCPLHGVTCRFFRSEAGFVSVLDEWGAFS